MLTAVSVVTYYLLAISLSDRILYFMYSGVSMYRYSCHTAQIHTSAVPNKVITTAVLQYISWRTSYSRLDWPFAPSHSSSEYYATYNRSSHYGLAMARSSRFGSIIAHSYPVFALAAAGVTHHSPLAGAGVLHQALRCYTPNPLGLGLGRDICMFSILAFATALTLRTIITR